MRKIVQFLGLPRALPQRENKVMVVYDDGTTEELRPDGRGAHFSSFSWGYMGDATVELAWAMLSAALPDNQTEVAGMYTEFARLVLSKLNGNCALAISMDTIADWARKHGLRAATFYIGVTGPYRDAEGQPMWLAEEITGDREVRERYAGDDEMLAIGEARAMQERAVKRDGKLPPIYVTRYQGRVTFLKSTRELDEGGSIGGKSSEVVVPFSELPYNLRLQIEMHISDLLRDSKGQA